MRSTICTCYDELCVVLFCTAFGRISLRSRVELSFVPNIHASYWCLNQILPQYQCALQLLCIFSRFESTLHSVFMFECPWCKSVLLRGLFVQHLWRNRIRYWVWLSLHKCDALFMRPWPPTVELRHVSMWVHTVRFRLPVPVLAVFTNDCTQPVMLYSVVAAFWCDTPNTFLVLTVNQSYDYFSYRRSMLVSVAALSPRSRKTGASFVGFLAFVLQESNWKFRLPFVARNL